MPRASAFALAVLLSAGPAGAQGIQVNDPLAIGIAGDVSLFRISPDSSRVVYSADQEVDGTVGLYGTPIGGGPVLQLVPEIDLVGPYAQGSSLDFQITPDSRTVVYVARTSAGYDLFSVSILGRQPGTRLSEALPVNHVTSFEISPDGRRVVYLQGPPTGGPLELFSVLVNGDKRVRLSGPLVTGGSVSAYRLSPGGRRVVYLADQETDQVRELYSVPVEGGVPVKLNRVLGAGQSVCDAFQLGSDGKHVVYRDAEFEARLFSVPLVGGASTELAGPSVEQFRITPDASRVVYVRAGGLNVVRLTGGASLPLSAPLVEPEHVNEFEIAPDSKRVVYHVENGRGPEGEEQVALYTVPIAGGSVTELFRSPGLYVSKQQISPDSRRVLYRVFDYSGTDEIWSAPIEGGAPTGLVSGELYFFGFHPDSRRILYVTSGHAPITNAFIAELFSVPVTGGTPTRLNGPLVEGGWVHPFAPPRISADGARVVYLADQERDDVLELFSVPIEGDAVTKLNPDLVEGGTTGDVEHSVVSPDGRHVLYRADQEADEVFELYSVALAGGAPAPGLPVKLNGALVRNGDVSPALFAVSPDSELALYVADQEVEGIGELYRVPIDGGAPLKLNATRGAGTGIHGFDLSPDSGRAVFLNDPDVAFRAELFSVPLDGGANVELSAAILDLDFVDQLAISADSRRVVFTALHGGGAALELYSIPIDGGSLTRLNPAPVAGGRVSSFELLPDSRAVVYTGDLERDDVVELYAVSIAGGPSVKLNGPIIRLGDVSGFSISPDSMYALYRADQEVNEVLELYRVSLASGARAKLNAALVAGGDVTSFRIAPDSSRVVYVGDQGQNDVFELFSVPIAGGPVTRLNPPLVANGDVDDTLLDSYQICPASERVVYLADQERNGWVELFSVPIAGGSVSKLNAPLLFGNGGMVQRGFALTADGRRVVFRTNQDDNQVFELFAAALEGGAPPRRLNGPLVEFGNVTPALESVRAFQLAGSRVLYRADQEQVQVFELFMSFLSWHEPSSTHHSRR